ncbi:MAG: hypothetical protein KDE35_07200, partial [Geminicoccaceae bacterium]|nr:hypothetical protein [Geminicoccaceae bacterium]
MSVRTLLVAVGAGIAGALITLALLTLDPIARRLGVTDPQPMAELAHEVQELADRTATLETRPAAGPFDSAPLTARLDALEKEVGDTLGQAVTSGPEADEALIARITEAVAGRTADTAQRATERLDALAAAADDDRETVRAVGAAHARLVEKLGALETRLTALGASLAEGPSRASLEVGLELLRARVDALAE